MHFVKSVVFYRSSKKEKEEEDAVGPKNALFCQPPLPTVPTTPPTFPTPGLPTPTITDANPAGPSTPTLSELGTPRSTSSVESRWGPGRPQKAITMPMLADCPPNATKDEMACWWKMKQSEFWQYQKLTGPEGEEY